MLYRALVLLTLIVGLYMYTSWRRDYARVRAAVDWVTNPMPTTLPALAEPREPAVPKAPVASPIIVPPSPARPAPTTGERYELVNQEIDRTKRELLDLSSEPPTDELRRRRQTLEARLRFLYAMQTQLP